MLGSSLLIEQLLDCPEGLGFMKSESESGVDRQVADL
jgi:hypothetical protein